MPEVDGVVVQALAAGRTPLGVGGVGELRQRDAGVVDAV
jgi:hypothetical protein